jgi:nitroreductase
MESINDSIEKAITLGRHTQRNWDLSREIPQDDLDLIISSATQCPSKQNIAYYRIHAITNRDVIESIHNSTYGFIINQRSITNTQVLANLLIVFEEVEIDFNDRNYHRNDQIVAIANGTATKEDWETLTRDKHMAVGLAAGYLNMTSALLGYSTGFCACFNFDGIKETLNLEKDPILLMGIGFDNDNLDRRAHHNHHHFVYPTKPKQEIKVSYWK